MAGTAMPTLLRGGNCLNPSGAEIASIASGWKLQLSQGDTVWRVAFDFMFVFLPPGHQVDQELSINTALGMTVRGHVPCVAPLDRLQDTYA